MARSIVPTLPGRGRRSRRLVERERIRDRLVSVAGVIGRPVRLADGREVGRVADVVVRWDHEPYPEVNGLVCKVGRRRAFVPGTQIEELTPTGATLGRARLDLRDFERRPGEVVLMDDVIDRQLVDVDGLQVVRASDLYLAELLGVFRLVGVEVGIGSLLRRLGPTRWRARATPERVIDWAAAQPFSDVGDPVRLSRPNQELHRLRPGDLARLLEDLNRPQRNELLSSLDPELAAEALEEMEPEQRDSLLRDSGAERAAAIVAEMEPDEAAEALRDLAEDERAEVLGHLPARSAEALAALLRYDARTAGGIMTTTLVVANRDETVATVVARLGSVEAHRGDIDAILIVDDEGALVDDVSLFELLLAPMAAPLGDLVAPPWPAVVAPDTALDDVVETLLANRTGSVVVADADGRPIGRILADDVLDALVPDGAWLRLWQEST